ncbi:hypothetical protein CHU98_g2628 [Xylaria longipes]|nr:hypothetical protein CHU98_g2628 [Xylaria longipes]
MLSGTKAAPEYDGQISPMTRANLGEASVFGIFMRVTVLSTPLLSARASTDSVDNGVHTISMTGAQDSFHHASRDETFGVVNEATRPVITHSMRANELVFSNAYNLKRQVCSWDTPVSYGKTITIHFGVSLDRGAISTPVMIYRGLPPQPAQTTTPISPPPATLHAPDVVAGQLGTGPMSTPADPPEDDPANPGAPEIILRELIPWPRFPSAFRYPLQDFYSVS